MTSLFIATPTHSGLVTTVYLESIIKLQAALAKAGIAMRLYRSIGADLVRARCESVATFLRGPCTHLLFVDADQGFEPNAIRRMLELDKPIVAAAVPAKQRTDEGGVQFVNVMLLPRPALREIDAVEVMAAGCGLMLLQREALEVMTERYQHLSYAGEGGPSVGLFTHLLHAGNLIGEDLSFCIRWYDVGGSVWLYTGANVVHVDGSQIFASTKSEREDFHQLLSNAVLDKASEGA